MYNCSQQYPECLLKETTPKIIKLNIQLSVGFFLSLFYISFLCVILKLSFVALQDFHCFSPIIQGRAILHMCHIYGLPLLWTMFNKKEIRIKHGGFIHVCIIMNPIYTPLVYSTTQLIAVINSWCNTDEMLACILNHCYCQWCEYVNASERIYSFIVFKYLMYWRVHVVWRCFLTN